MINIKGLKGLEKILQFIDKIQDINQLKFGYTNVIIIKYY